MQDELQVEEGTRRLATLDGVRGLAILLVMQLHFWAMGFAINKQPATMEVDRFVAKVAGTGWAGVELFFVLSGFLITRILVQSKGGQGYFRAFYVRRALRIFPAYYAFLAFSVFALPHLSFLELSRDATHLRDDQIWLWTYSLNIGFSFWDLVPSVPFSFIHLWSLAFEEQFYLVWPVVIALLKRKQLVVLCVLMIVGSFAVRVVISSSAVDETFTQVAPRQLVPAHCDTLAIGALLALVSWDARALDDWRPNVLLAAGCSVIVLVALFMTKDGLALQDRSVQTVGFLALTILCGSVVYGALTARAGGIVHRVLTSRVLAALGRYSYGMYLVHLLVGVELATVVANRGLIRTFAGSQIPANVGLSLTATGATFVVAWLSWQLLEARILAFKDRVPYGRPRMSSGTLAEARGK